MKPRGLGGGVTPCPKARTTVPAADLAGRPDLIERNFTADAPARKLVGDITHMLLTREGFVYLATVMDCYSKRIVGYAMAEHMRTKLAVRECRPIKGVTIFHSDRGSQYTSADYTATMNKYGFLASVGRTGVCYDNAAADITQRHPQERTRQPEDLPHQKKSNQRGDIMD